MELAKKKEQIFMKLTKLDQEEISITLPRWIWEKIMSACITVADWPEDINDEIIEDLRKTYYQIKSEIR